MSDVHNQLDTTCAAPPPFWLRYFDRNIRWIFIQVGEDELLGGVRERMGFDGETDKDGLILRRIETGQPRWHNISGRHGRALWLACFINGVYSLIDIYLRNIKYL